ncbi:MAG: transketolase [Deltaproteobacteria bacterium]|nr:transketolase [Deltaproteobacteria bacterium]
MKKGFIIEKLDDAALTSLKQLANTARGDILTMTTLAGCGHPGGSMSSIDMYITLLACANTFPDDPRNPERDRIVISHGHTSPAAYAALARTGFIDADDAISGFRLAGTIYEGHVERIVPGIEWGTGNLGQGLSAACGFALAGKMQDKQFNTFVVMGDGEQQKGQIAEARRFAVKYNLNNITALIDFNKLQISGDIAEVMPQNIKENFTSDGWQVLEIDGHDIGQIYEALHSAVNDSSAPTLIMANTIMGKGVSLMENVAKYHGVALNQEQYETAMQELSLEPLLARAQELRSKITAAPAPAGSACTCACGCETSIATGQAITYAVDKKTDNRSAFGNALKSIAEAAKAQGGPVPLAVFDCDLSGSVKTDGFQAVLPDNFFQVGIQEHNAATMAGAMSTQGFTSFFADFGVFGVCETYNQHRLNDINHSNLKLVCTHVGLDVGEDGKTHQCIDYIGLFQNIFGFKILVPADPNQTDRATRYMTATKGNFLLAMGRSKLPTILNEAGEPYYGDNYELTYGKIDLIREGTDATIMSYGGMLHRAVEAADILKQKGISIKVMSVCCPKDLDDESIREAAKTGLIVTYEDHIAQTGLGGLVAGKLVDLQQSARMVKLGVSNYGLSGKPDVLYKKAGLDVDALVATIEKAL